MFVLISRRKLSGRINTSLEIQFQIEREYWHSVLKRIVSTVKFLSTRGLAFRGQNEQINSEQNGNYLGILELISEFDPFLSNHLAKYGNKGKGRASYLSSTICEEVIQIMGEKLLLIITNEVKEAKYFSLSVDSTPDLRHVDQLTIILRYIEKSSHQVTERFLKFLPIESHTGEYLANTVLQFLKKQGIDVGGIRGQSYDNASNMSGRYKGMQARIREVNYNAVYISCTAHSLNLVGLCAVDSCIEAVSFFGIVQNVYVFFSASTYRWSVLTKALGSNLSVVKRLSETRWSAHADAIKALYFGYTQIQEALKDLAGNEQQRCETRHEAASLLNKLSHLETVFMTDFWHQILERIHKTNEALQKEKMELATAVEYRQSTKRQIKRKKQFGEGNSENIVLDGSLKFRVDSFLPILDNLSVALKTRIEAYEQVYNLFGFLYEFRHISEKDIELACERLKQEYRSDLEEEFTEEYKHFCHFVDLEIKSCDLVSVQQIYDTLFDYQLVSTFPNVEIMMRIYLSLMITNATGERSFSKLKLILNEKRTCMKQERLNYLSLMSIESELLKKVEFEDVLRTFVEMKSRKVNF